MAKILSFEVTDEFYEKIVGAQQKIGFTYLSPFLRHLVENALLVLERNPATGVDK
jgi:hypothetical protein